MTWNFHEHVPRAGIAHPHLPGLEVGVVTVEVVALVVVELLLAFACKVDDIGGELGLEPAGKSGCAWELAFVLDLAAFHRLAESNHAAGENAYLVRCQVCGLEVLEHRVAHGGFHRLAVVDEGNIATVIDSCTLTVDALDARLHFGMRFVPIVHETPELLRARDAFALEQDERPFVIVFLGSPARTVVGSAQKVKIFLGPCHARKFRQAPCDIAVACLFRERADVYLHDLASVFLLPFVLPKRELAADVSLGNAQKLCGLFCGYPNRFHRWPSG